MTIQGFVIDKVDRRKIALLALKHRLALEIKFPGMAGGRTARFTLQSAKGWGFTGRTRKQAYAWVIEQLEPKPQWEECFNCTTNEETRNCPACNEPVCENCATTQDLDDRDGS